MEHLKLPLRSWQEIVPGAVLEAKKFCIFDTVGVGKTIEAIATAVRLSESRIVKAIVIAESSTVRQWQDEIEKFSTFFTFKVTSGSKQKREATYNSFKSYPSSAILVINYGKLRFDFDLIYNLKANFIIYDEAAILSNPNETKNYAAWLNKKTEYAIAMTATPISRDIMQFWDIFSVMGIEPVDREYFLQNFADFEYERIRSKKGPITKINIKGAKNVRIMREIYQKFYIRRAKKDIKTADELIKHNFYYRLFELNRDQKALYSQAKDGYLTTYRNSTLEAKELIPLSAYTAILQILDSAYLMDNRLPKDSPKLDGLLSLISEIDEQKIIIYSKFKVMGGLILDALPKGKAVFLHGDLNEKQFDAAKKSFLLSKDVRFCVVTDVAQKGLNLQVANTMIFMDLPFTPDAIFQLIGRMDREGQESPFLNMFFMLMDDSVEFNIFKILKDRQQVFDSVFDEERAANFQISIQDFVKAL